MIVLLCGAKQRQWADRGRNGSSIQISRCEGVEFISRFILEPSSKVFLRRLVELLLACNNITNNKNIR